MRSVPFCIGTSFTSAELQRTALRDRPPSGDGTVIIREGEGTGSLGGALLSWQGGYKVKGQRFGPLSIFAPSASTRLPHIPSGPRFGALEVGQWHLFVCKVCICEKLLSRVFLFFFRLVPAVSAALGGEP